MHIIIGSFDYNRMMPIIHWDSYSAMINRVSVIARRMTRQLRL